MPQAFRGAPVFSSCPQIAKAEERWGRVKSSWFSYCSSEAGLKERCGLLTKQNQTSPCGRHHAVSNACNSLGHCCQRCQILCFARLPVSSSCHTPFTSSCGMSGVVMDTSVPTVPPARAPLRLPFCPAAGSVPYPAPGFVLGKAAGDSGR